MKKLMMLTMLALAFATTLVFADDKETNMGESARGEMQSGKPRLTPEQKAELKKSIEIRRGGPKVARPGTLKGKIVVVNAQTAVDAGWLVAAVEYLRKDTKFFIDFVNGEFSFPKPRIVGDATIYVIDDSAMPRVLTAAEDRWGMMNVAPLKSDKEAFFKARVKKEMSRAFAMLCGGMSSNYGISLVGAVSKTEDLDVFPNERLPIDVIMRMEPYMAWFGVSPAKLVPYRIACQEGWASPPSNDVQRAIWNQVHQIPDKPLTIEYDPKVDK